MSGDHLDLDAIEARAAVADHFPSAIHTLDHDVPALVAEVRRLRAFEQRLRDLFSGGPDTPCRTTWRQSDWELLRREGAGQVECVEVPMGDLREAFSP